MASRPGAWCRPRSARACERFVFFSVLDASTHHRARFFRAKALAEQAVRESDMRSTIFAPSIVYAPGDPWLTLLERLALLPVVPISGRGRAIYQPIWAEDVADCVMAALKRKPSAGAGDHGTERFELAGPETLSHNDIVRLVLRSLDRRRPLVHVPTPIVSRVLRLLEAATGPARVRDLGRGRADGDIDDLLARHRRPRALRRHARADARDPGSRAGLVVRAALLRTPQAQETGGRRSAHGRAASSCVASASSPASPAGRPTSCTPSGRPSSPSNSGSEMPG